MKPVRVGHSAPRSCELHLSEPVARCFQASRAGGEFSHIYESIGDEKNGGRLYAEGQFGTREDYAGYVLPDFQGNLVLANNNCIGPNNCSADDAIKKLDRLTGQVIWQYTPDNRFDSVSLFPDGTVIFAYRHFDSTS